MSILHLKTRRSKKGPTPYINEGLYSNLISLPWNIVVRALECHFRVFEFQIVGSVKIIAIKYRRLANTSWIEGFEI